MRCEQQLARSAKTIDLKMRLEFLIFVWPLVVTQPVL